MRKEAKSIITQIATKANALRLTQTDALKKTMREDEKQRADVADLVVGENIAKLTRCVRDITVERDEVNELLRDSLTKIKGLCES